MIIHSDIPIISKWQQNEILAGLGALTSPHGINSHNIISANIGLICMQNV